MARYRYVRERISNVWFKEKQYERIRDPQGRGWIIWLEWEQYYGVLPEKASSTDAIAQYVQRHQLAQAEDGHLAIELAPGPESWELADPPQAAPAGLQDYFDPFAPRSNGHG
jgi:hypothetical protein